VRTKKISESTIRRLSSYYRVLEEDEAGGETVTNSEKLAAKAHADTRPGEERSFILRGPSVNGESATT